MKVDDVDKITENIIRRYINDLQERGKYTFYANDKGKEKNFPDRRRDFRKPIISAPSACTPRRSKQLLCCSSLPSLHPPGSYFLHNSKSPKGFPYFFEGNRKTFGGLSFIEEYLVFQYFLYYTTYDIIMS
jgi:hypothetical protein